MRDLHSAWLGAAEAPTKVVTLGISPVAISLVMVLGVFVARWSLPALIRGTANVGVDVRRAPHLIVWALLAGCIWAVANTLTIFGDTQTVTRPQLGFTLIRLLSLTVAVVSMGRVPRGGGQLAG